MMYTCPAISYASGTAQTVRSALTATSRIAIEQCNALNSPAQQIAWFHAIQDWATEQIATLRGNTGHIGGAASTGAGEG
jgi:hypothetical protein